MDPKVLSEAFRSEYQRHPASGDLFSNRDELFQFTNGNWRVICPLIEEEVSEEEAILFEILPGIVLTGSRDYLVAAIYKVASGDPRATEEHFTGAVRRIYEQDGWRSRREGQEGRVCFFPDPFKNLNTSDLDYVASQLREDPNRLFLEIPQDQGGISFYNLRDVEFLTLKEHEN